MTRLPALKFAVSVLLVAFACCGEPPARLQFGDVNGKSTAIEWDGKLLNVPQHCRSETCADYSARFAAQQTVNAALVAENRALRTLLEQLTARVLANENAHTADAQALVSARRDFEAADDQLSAAVTAVTKMEGPKGDKGATGAMGARGATGAAGAKGERGHDGFVGRDGTDGAKGAKGDTGAAGEAPPVDCGAGKYWDAASEHCDSCHASCKTCSAAGPTKCVSCNSFGARSGKLIAGECLETCAADGSEYRDSGTKRCRPCADKTPHCTQCSMDGTCTQCQLTTAAAPIAITNQGGQGDPGKVLHECEADCDYDDTRNDGCADGLFCFQRDTNDGNSGHVPPGCKKGDSFSSDWDICYDPTKNTGKHLVARGGDPISTTLFRCEGDCDSDADCKSGLKCFQRDGSEKIPGCKAGGEGDVHGWDYCYDPTDTSDASPPSTSYELDAVALCIPTCTAGKEYRDPQTKQCRPCAEADANCMECGMDGKCTKCRPAHALLPVRDMGGQGDPGKVLGKCEADCDYSAARDDGCGQGLTCFQRDSNHGNSGHVPPGCKKGDPFSSDWDICYDPNDNIHHNLVARGGDAHGDTPWTLFRCEGDCDSDADCKSGLKCFQRDGSEKIPGCKAGGEGDVHGWDYCYDPTNTDDASDPLAEAEFVISPKGICVIKTP